MKITVTNKYGEELELLLYNPEKTGFFLIEVTGLGGPESEIILLDRARVRGSIPQGARTASRNITMSLGVVGTTPSDLNEYRFKLYRHFPSGTQVTFRVELGGRDVSIDGQVERNESHIFAKVVNNDLSILCADPYFRGTVQKHQPIQKVTNAFSFPFTNPVGTKEIVFGVLSTEIQAKVDYGGEVSTGVVFNLVFTNDADNFKIYNQTRNGYQTMSVDASEIEAITGEKFKKGDLLTIDTRLGKKGVVLLRNGLYWNVLNALDDYVDWITLSRTENMIRLEADNETEHAIDMTMDYYELFEGA